MRDARSGIIKHNNYDNPPIETRKKTPSYNYLQQVNSSPINILEQENKRPSLTKYGQAEQEKQIKSTQNYRNLKKTYETKPRFFDIDYQRIEQLKGKYLQTYGIRNQMVQYEHAPLQQIHQQFRGSIHRANQRPHSSQIKSKIILQNDKSIEYQDKPLEIQNEQLKSYMMKYSVLMNSELAEPPNQATQHTLTKINEINEEIETKMSNLFKRLEKKEEKRKKRKQAEQLPQITQKIQLPIPKSQDRTSYLFHLIDNQIKLDIKFRTLRQKIPKAQLDNILASVQAIEPEITKDILQLNKSEINPFDCKEDKKIQQGIQDKLVAAYRQAQKHFQNQLLHKIQMKILQQWIDQVNIDRSENISMGNILTQLNLRVQGEYRHRDIVRLVMRFGGSKEISQSAFRKMLGK